MLDAEHQDFSEVDNLEGLITGDIGRVLYDAARVVPANQAIVELGSYLGKSTAYLALGAREGNGQVVVAVDTWSEGNSAWRASVMDRIPSPTAERFQEQLTWIGLIDQVQPYHGTTTAAAREYEEALRDGDVSPIGLLYVDADHAYEAVIADFQEWRDLLAPGAVILFDDFTKSNPGVVRALRELRDDGRIVPFDTGIPRLVGAHLGEAR